MRAALHQGREQARHREGLAGAGPTDDQREALRRRKTHGSRSLAIRPISARAAREQPCERRIEIGDARGLRHLASGTRHERGRDTLLLDIHTPGQQQRSIRRTAPRLRDERLQRLIRATDHGRCDRACSPRGHVCRPRQIFAILDMAVPLKRGQIDARMTDARRARCERQPQHPLDILLGEARCRDRDGMHLGGCEHASVDERLCTGEERGANSGVTVVRHGAPPLNASSINSMVRLLQRCAKTPRQRPVTAHRGVSGPAMPRTKR